MLKPIFIKKLITTMSEVLAITVLVIIILKEYDRDDDADDNGNMK